MQALQIDCCLAGAWCPPSYGLHLDGLVAWSVVQDSLEQGDATMDYAKAISDLPFERHASGVWCASQFFPVGWIGQEQRYYTGKTPVDHLAECIGNGAVDTKGGAVIDTVRGIAKNHQGYLTLEHVRGLRAWCVGDEDAIIELLGKIEAVGVKTRMGFGALLPYEDGSLWRITPCEEATEHWKRRSSPVQLTQESYPARGAHQPPYWRGNEFIYRSFPMRYET